MAVANLDEKLTVINEDHHGLHLISGPPSVEIRSTLCSQTRAMTISRDGNYIAFSDNQTIKMVDLNDSSVKFTRDVPGGVLFMGISPKNRYLQTWMHTKGPEGVNLTVYDAQSSDPDQCRIMEIKQKQSQWKLHWTDDESICVRFFNEELHFYENNCFDRYVAKFYNQKVADFSLTTNAKSGVHYFACLSLGSHGQPNFVRLYRYPQMETAIANRSFFRTDRATFKWRSRGDAVLILCAADVDKTGKSYYGESNLNYMDVNGKSFAVKLDKDGPIHAVEWHPSASQTLFCVSYGFVPPKLALVDSDGKVIYAFGERHVNQIHFNPFGNLVIFAGFGNLRGGLAIYNTEKKIQVAQLTSPDTTYIAWAPDGVHLLTAVTSPRMRVGNCLRVWHYSGKLIREISYPDGDSLFRSLWRPNQNDFPAAPKVLETEMKASATGIESEPARYVPPHLRKSGATSSVVASGEPSSGNGNVNRQAKGKGAGGRRGRGARGAGPGGDRSGRGANTLGAGAGGGIGKGGVEPDDDNNNTNGGDGRERKVKAIEKKLDAIKKLKSIRDSGGQLEKNQSAKIAKEKELITELKNLQLAQ